MSWDVVRKELLNQVVRRMSTTMQADGGRWDDLLAESDDGKRLGACIVIDFRYGALTPDDFAAILNYLDFSKESAQQSGCWAFHDAVMNHPANQSNPLKANFVCSSCFQTENSTETEIYVRVLDLGEFITYVLDTNENPMSALNQEDRRRARWMYFSGFDQPWEEIDTMWSGPMGRAFVTSLKDLDEVLEDADDPGHTVNDALGLGMKGDLEFVAVKYASGQPPITYQPTTLDLRWVNENWYVSYKRGNGWGRTHRCSGEGRPGIERVHKALPLMPSGFSGQYIGIPRRRLSEDRDKLLKDAFDRM